LLFLSQSITSNTEINHLDILDSYELAINPGTAIAEENYRLDRSHTKCSSWLWHYYKNLLRACPLPPTHYGMAWSRQPSIMIVRVPLYMVLSLRDCAHLVSH